MSDLDPDNDVNRPLGRANTLVRQQPRGIPWLWDGVLALQAVTLLSAPEKTGKTTLLSLLLDRRRAGGQLLGRTIRPGKTVLCSEESERIWALRQPPLDFGPELIFHQPEFGRPSRGRWARFAEELRGHSLLVRPDGFELLVIDTAVRFLPLAERNPRTLPWVLAELREIALNFAAVLLLNQSRNMHRPLAAFADIVLEMSIPRQSGDRPTRRRHFSAVGRYPDTLDSLTAELNLEGTNYIFSSDPPAAAAPLLLSTVQQLLGVSPTPLTREELRARWPGPPPREDSLGRTLTRATETGLLTRSGAGTKVDAFRYGLAG